MHSSRYGACWYDGVTMEMLGSNEEAPNRPTDGPRIVSAPRAGRQPRAPDSRGIVEEAMEADERQLGPRRIPVPFLADD